MPQGSQNSIIEVDKNDCISGLEVRGGSCIDGITFKFKDEEKADMDFGGSGGFPH